MEKREDDENFDSQFITNLDESVLNMKKKWLDVTSMKRVLGGEKAIKFFNS